MRTAYVAGLLAGLAAAMPQGIDYAVINEAPAATILGPPLAAFVQTAVCVDRAGHQRDTV